MCDNHIHRGISLKDKDAHQEDHQSWSRRGFMQTLGLAGGAALTFGGFSVKAMASGAAMPLMFDRNNDKRILVLIRLKGGNDGLNTIIPIYDYGTYSQARPNIAIESSDLIRLNDEHAIPKSMESIMNLWNDGSMKVINTVGYPEHNLSHFTSSDVWNTADPGIESNPNKSGWLGRYILENNPNYLDDLPDVPGAIKISSGSNVAFQTGDEIDMAVNFNTPDRLLSVAESGSAFDVDNLPNDCYYGEQVGFLRTLLNATYQYAPVISDAYSRGMNAVEYEQNELSRQLAIVAKLIKGNLGTRLYMVTLDGFDTHENQAQKHPKLLRELSTAISSFYADLKSSQQDKHVLSMSFSEFGRRIKENDGGTDHGTAAPVMMFGPSLNGNGILGDNPDLQDVDQTGNLKHSTDFRSIYASILEYWLCMSSEEVDHIMGSSFERMDNLGFKCRRRRRLSLSDANRHDSIHYSVADGYGGESIHFRLNQPGNVHVSIYAITGQKVATLYDGFEMEGDHQVTYRPKFMGITAAPLVYRLIVDGRQYSGKFMVHNGR